ncbi:oxidoreductase [Chryseolinea lacunae]|uniref:SDR family NAD(P)-dependent oxidoreductase n=1 Tax=Chryseolinea lacunae TaxID=2801331 RepID=A0ABS1KV09_9BACT|nr:oxidoreductase [Chryseolinea lacunae]MBL0743138.1 SDR family NAD(P)-dependent oxidoreductase [Chryseolinea lacunae]
MKKKVWFVTGASQGLGLTLVKKLLREGYRVAATSRNRDELAKAVASDGEDFLPLQTDLKNESSVAKSIADTLAHFGAIDVVVNNAGYGLAGSIEELSDEEARGNFDVNVFGLLNVTRQVLPHLRAQRSGHIFNISSIGGFTGAFPGFGIYCATKFAVQGLSESLAAEVAPFGIQVTAVSPGYFRTNFLMESSLRVPRHEIADYRNVREMQDAHQHSYNGNQSGDPEKAASVILGVVESNENVLNLFLGPDAYALAEQKISAVQKDMLQVKAVATATNF